MMIAAKVLPRRADTYNMNKLIDTLRMLGIYVAFFLCFAVPTHMVLDTKVEIPTLLSAEPSAPVVSEERSGLSFSQRLQQTPGYAEKVEQGSRFIEDRRGPQISSYRIER